MRRKLKSPKAMYGDAQCHRPHSGDWRKEPPAPGKGTRAWGVLSLSHEPPAGTAARTWVCSHSVFVPKKGLNSFVDFVSLVSAFPFLVFFSFLLFVLSHFYAFCPLLVFYFTVSLSLFQTPPLPFCLSPSPPLPCLVLFEVEPSGGTPRRRPLSFCPCCVQEGNVTPLPHPTASQAVAT